MIRRITAWLRETFTVIPYTITSRGLRALSVVTLVLVLAGVLADTGSTVLFTLKCGWWTEGNTFARSILLQQGIRGFLYWNLESYLPLVMFPLLVLLLSRLAVWRPRISSFIAITLVSVALIGAFKLAALSSNLSFWANCYPWGFY